MAKLENVSIDDLQNALDGIDGRKPVQRLMLAILYKQGPSVPMIADWFDMRDETIYAWFSAMEEEPLVEAIYDDTRPGRPSKLTEDQREAFERAVRLPPEESGIDAATWTPKVAKQYLETEYDVDYSLRHVRRLLTEAGVSWQTTQPQSSNVDTRRSDEEESD